ncbi:MAG: hypothetical protein MPN21_15210 [Thermoanaerobaculia bacterium]|nr:hypothetical protein [Thermoanaerobaculia bacterium]
MNVPPCFFESRAEVLGVAFVVVVPRLTAIQRSDAPRLSLLYALVSACVHSVSRQWTFLAIDQSQCHGCDPHDEPENSHDFTVWWLHRWRFERICHSALRFESQLDGPLDPGLDRSLRTSSMAQALL